MGKTIIYQLLIRAIGSNPASDSSLSLCGKFDYVTTDFLLHLKKDLSVTAVWFTGVIAHGSKTNYPNLQNCNPSIVKGEAGSPYAIRDYYDISPQLAVNPEKRFEEFESLIKRTHNCNLKVIIDFVPNHVFRQYKSQVDNFTCDNYYILKEDLHLPQSLNSDYLESPAKATGNDCFNAYPSINDWYETVKLNYGNRSTWDKMLNIMLFWLSKGVDGFRCDMVELVPVEFFGWAISKVRQRYPSTIFIGEVYDTKNYQRYVQSGGFDLLYDKSVCYDRLIDVIKGNRSARALTEIWQQTDYLQQHLLRFLENHDEQRLASDFVAKCGLKAIPALIYALLFNQSPFLLYFAQELGESAMEQIPYNENQTSQWFSSINGRTSIFDYCAVESLNRFILGMSKQTESIIYNRYKSIMHYAQLPVFAQGSSFDLCYANYDNADFNPDKNFAFLRAYKGECYLIALNFSDNKSELKINIPSHAFEYLDIESNEHFNSSNPFICTVDAEDGLICKVSDNNSAL